MRKTFRTPFLHATLFVLVMPIPGATVLEAAGSGSSTQSEIPSPQRDPAAMARDAYERGIELKKKAWDLESEAAAATGGSKDKLMKKAAKAYEKAARSFRDATDGMPDMHQAWSELGYALRKTGDYDASLAAYDRALSIQPGFPQAVEYRAVAYLHLGRIEDAKAAYMELFPDERQLADELMEAMKAWVENPSGADGAAVEEFSSWIDERETLAGQTASLYTTGIAAW